MFALAGIVVVAVFVVRIMVVAGSVVVAVVMLIGLMKFVEMLVAAYLRGTQEKESMVKVKKQQESEDVE